jgi:hypothetical protein
MIAVGSLRLDEAIRLFVERAAEARAGFTVARDDPERLEGLCRRLDGMPLAIELAAARVRTMTLSELVERLDQRFRVLTGGSRTALERHRTLRSTVDWSYDLLDDAERVALNRLSVFAGGCTLDAAETVLADRLIRAEDVFAVVGQLVDKSLVIADDSAGVMRYRLLETIRQYAQERLEQVGDGEVVRRSHAEWYVSVAEAAYAHLRSREQLEWVKRVELEIDNWRAAVAWCVAAGEADLALRLVVATNVNAVRTSYPALAWAETVAHMPAAIEHPLLPDALAWAAWSAVYRSDLDTGRHLIARMDEAERVLGTPPSPARYQARATLALFSGALEEAAHHAHAWVDLARATGDDYELVQALTVLASGPPDRLTDQTRAAAHEAVEVGRRVGAPGVLSFALIVLSSQYFVDDAPRALDTLTEAADVAALVGNDQGVSQARMMTAWLERQSGNSLAALRSAADALEHAQRIGAQHSVASAMLVGASALADRGECVAAAFAWRVCGAGAGSVAQRPLGRGQGLDPTNYSPKTRCRTRG